MKRYLGIAAILMIYLNLQAAPIDYGIDKGDKREDFSVTVNSYTYRSTPVLSETVLKYCKDYDYTNNGSYDIYISTYANFDTAKTGFGIRTIKSGTFYSPNGHSGAPLYMATEKGTANSSKVDGSIYK